MAFLALFKTQIEGKAVAGIYLRITGAATTIDGADLQLLEHLSQVVLVRLQYLQVSSTELGYLDGVTLETDAISINGQSQQTATEVYLLLMLPLLRLRMVAYRVDLQLT